MGAICGKMQMTEVALRARRLCFRCLFVGAQHATPCAVRRIMNLCEKAPLKDTLAPPPPQASPSSSTKYCLPVATRGNAAPLIFLYVFLNSIPFSTLQIGGRLWAEGRQTVDSLKADCVCIASFFYFSPPSHPLFYTTSFISTLTIFTISLLKSLFMYS